MLTYFTRPENTPEQDGTAWYAVETLIGSKPRRLKDEEVDSLVGHTESWVVTGPSGTVTVTVEVRHNGWHLRPGPGKNVDAFTLSLTFARASYAAAFHHPDGTTEVQSLVRPDGMTVDILRLRYVTGDVITDVSHPYWQDLVEMERDVYGIKMFWGRLISGWTFGLGSLRHQEAVHGTTNNDPQQHTVAEHASYRADLAILRAFKIHPIHVNLWKWAKVNTPYRVEMRWNHTGSWMPVGPKGLPMDDSVLDTPEA